MADLIYKLTLLWMVLGVGAWISDPNSGGHVAFGVAMGIAFVVGCGAAIKGSNL